MRSARLDVGDLLMLTILGVPFYVLGGPVPVITLLLVVAGSSLGYLGRPMPMAKQLMVPGFIAGMVGTSLIKIFARQFGYIVMITSREVVWWSAWFAFWSAPLLIALVLRTRGVGLGQASDQSNDTSRSG